MLKCGQKDNTKYTFGLRKEQISEEGDSVSASNKEYITKCSKCGAIIQSFSKYCSFCGSEIK